MSLTAFINIFGFLPSLDLDYHLVPRELNPNAFWHTITTSYQYDASHSKGTIIRNPCIRVIQCVLAHGLFDWEDSLTMHYLSELYSLYNMLQRIGIDPGSFFTNQLLSAAINSVKRIVIGDLITPIARSVVLNLTLMIECLGLSS